MTAIGAASSAGAEPAILHAEIALIGRDRDDELLRKLDAYRRRAGNAPAGSTAAAARAVTARPLGAAGGLGGFFPPIVMATVRATTGSYTLGFLLISATAVVCLAVLVLMLGRPPARHPTAASPRQAARP